MGLFHFVTWLTFISKKPNAMNPGTGIFTDVRGLDKDICIEYNLSL